MATYTSADAECFIFTLKEGLLSKVAHDLKIRVQSFEVNVDEGKVEASFDATSLRVECARKDGSDTPGALSASDKSKIEGNMQKDVLHTRKHPKATFSSNEVSIDGDSATVKGDLTLHGATRSVTARVTKSDGRWQTELRINQPDFGIKPFSAMLGTLKVKAEVIVRISVPA